MVCTGTFCMGTSSAFQAVIPVCVSVVRPSLLCFNRHPVADLAALSAASFPFMFLWAGIQ